ncbi:MAG: sulfatase [Candidatus Omnitrophica bacterium]|nr:sulfatase [Candidatus Omnitrophota bacterium]
MNAVDVFLIGMFAEGYLRNPEVSAYQRVDFFYASFLTNFLFWLYPALLLTSRRLLGRVIGIALGLVFSLLYAASWSSYRFLHHFLNGEDIRFIFHNPLQIALHILSINPVSFLTLLFTALLALAFMVLLTSAIPWLLDKVRSRSLMVSAGGTAAVFFAFLIFKSVPVAFAFSRAGVIPGSNQNMIKESLELFSKHVAPPSTLFSDLFFRHERKEIFEDLTFGSENLLSQWHRQEPLTSFRNRVLPDLQRYPVIVVMVESLRSDVLEHPEVMPNLAGLAKESLVFPNAFATSSHSDYADTAVLSSHYPLRSTQHHYYPKNIPYPRVLVYDVLKVLGYATAVFSAQNESWGDMRNYLETGYLDVFFDATSATGPEELYVPFGDTGFEKFFARMEHAGKLDDRIVLEKALDWLDSVNNRNFFLLLNFQRSHFPYLWPDDFKPPLEPFEIDFGKIQFGSYPKSTVPAMKNRYFNSLSYIDMQIGKLLEYLKAAGIYDETVLVVTGDNGEAFYEHNIACHASELYNEVIRVPIIIKSPQSQERGERNDYVQHIDIPPSIFHLLGIESHPSFQGLNLFQKIHWERRPIFLVAQTGLADQEAVILGKWKLIRDLGFARRNRLYNLRNDFEERENLVADNPALANLLRQLLTRQLLAEWHDIQIDFYEDSEKRKTYYPPRILPLSEFILTAYQADAVEQEQ